MTDFADLRLGGLDRNRTSWAKIKTFPNNVEIQVEATFSNHPAPVKGALPGPVSGGMPQMGPSDTGRNGQ